MGLDATKVYSATGIIGRISFSYNGGGNQDTDVSVEPKSVSTTDLDAVVAAPRLTGPGAKVSRTKAEPKTDVATLGRKRRQA